MVLLAGRPTYCIAPRKLWPAPPATHGHNPATATIRGVFHSDARLLSRRIWSLHTLLADSGPGQESWGAAGVQRQRWHAGIRSRFLKYYCRRSVRARQCWRAWLCQCAAAPSSSSDMRGSGTRPAGSSLPESGAGLPRSRSNRRHGGRDRTGCRLGSFTLFGRCCGIKSAMISVVLALPALLALLGGAAGQPPSQLNLCLEFGHKEAGFYLAPSLLAAYTLAGEHIEMRNCSLVPDCEALLSPPGGGGGDGGTSPASTAFTSVRFRTWRAQEYHSAVHSAVAALECNTWGGDLYLLDQNSLADTLVPINTANRLVTAAAVLGGGDHALNLDGDHRASFLRYCT